MNERLNALLTYLDALTKLHASEYHCTSEIKKCTALIEEQLGVKKPKPTERIVNIGDTDFGRMKGVRE